MTNYLLFLDAVIVALVLGILFVSVEICRLRVRTEDFRSSMDTGGLRSFHDSCEDIGAAGIYTHAPVSPTNGPAPAVPSAPVNSSRVVDGVVDRLVICEVDQSVMRDRVCSMNNEINTNDSTNDRCLVPLKDIPRLAEDGSLIWTGTLQGVRSSGIRYLSIHTPWSNKGYPLSLPFYVDASTKSNDNWALVYKYVSRNTAVEYSPPMAMFQAASRVDAVKETLSNIARASPYATENNHRVAYIHPILITSELWHYSPFTHAKVVAMKNTTTLAEYTFRIVTNTPSMLKLDRMGWMTPETFVSTSFLKADRLMRIISNERYPSGFGIDGLVVPGFNTGTQVSLHWNVRSTAMRSPQQNPQETPLQNKKNQKYCDASVTPGFLVCPCATTPDSNNNTNNTTNNNTNNKPDTSGQVCWHESLDGLIITSVDGAEVKVEDLLAQVKAGMDVIASRRLGDALETMSQTVNLATHLLIFLGNKSESV